MSKQLDPAALSAQLAEAYARRYKPLAARLEPVWRDYTQSVSEEDMAMSLETAVLLMMLAEIARPASMVDLGSGLSSWVLRLAARDLDNQAAVVSVDTDPGWLDKSREFCQRMGEEGGEFRTWPADGDLGRRFDLVLVDMDGFPQRKNYVVPVLKNLCHPGTLLVFDDMHSPRYRHYLLETLQTFDFAHLNVRKYTLDHYGRYATLFTGVA